LAVYQGVAKDTKGEVLKDLVITVYNPDGDIAGEYRPNDQTGRYLFILQPGQTYDLEYNDKGAIGKDQVIVAATGGVKDIIKVATKENDKITVASGEIVDGEILALINTENPDNVEITNIDITVNTKDPKESVNGGDNKDPFKPVVTEYASQNDMMKDLYFIYDKTKIIEKSVADYNRTLQYLKDNPKVKVVIEGHTDANGSDEYNMWLASARSNKIKNMLNQDGISWSRMTTKNYGESKPIAPNMNPDGTDNPEGRQLNRRVSFAETAQQMASETDVKVEEEEVITISVGGQNTANVTSNSAQNYTVFEFGEDDVVFKVQLGAFRKKIDETKFDNAEEVGFYKGNDNLYKYFSGTFLSKSMADEHRKRMAAEGYPDAFIVYFKEGKRLSTEEIARLFPDNDCNTLIETAIEK
jgi:outer membrane protein OmpA-like peptidoglycan-associated protein